MPPTQSTALPLRLVIDPDDAVARSPASGRVPACGWAAASSEFEASFEPWTDAAGCDYGYSFEEEGEASGAGAEDLSARHPPTATLVVLIDRRHRNSPAQALAATLLRSRLA